MRPRVGGRHHISVGIKLFVETKIPILHQDIGGVRRLLRNKI
ncbi:MAG: hypothetical protein ACI9ZH_000986, partial [Paracoccaceae bacterium]